MSQKEREVWQACEDLLAQGKSPQEITGEAIGNRLRELGFKAGSLTYRYRYRDSWMARQGLSRESTQNTELKRDDIIERSAVVFKKSLEESLRLEFEKKLQDKQDLMQSELLQIKNQNRELRQLLHTKQEELIHAQEKAYYAERLYQEKMLESEKFSADLKKTQKENLQMIKKMIEESKLEYVNSLRELQLKYESEHQHWNTERDNLKYEISKFENALDKALLFEKQASEEIKALNALLNKKEQQRHELEDLFYHERAKLNRVDERLKIALSEIKQLEKIV